MNNDTIICGDNVAVLSAFPADCIDLVVTSPPYDNLRTYGGHSWDFPAVAEQLTRVLKPGGVIVWVVNDKTDEGDESGTSFRQALHFKDVSGLRLHDTMIWHRCGAFPETNRYHPAFEFMFILSKGQPITTNIIMDRETAHGGVQQKCRMERQTNGDVRRPNRSYVMRDKAARYNIWDVKAGFSTSAEESFAFQHPAIFPEALAGDHIRSWSNEGDLVLDPFNGSGTTTKMARELGRHYIGIDVNEEYCSIARKRLEQQLLFPL